MDEVDRLIAAYHVDEGLKAEVGAITRTPVTLENYRYAMHYIFNNIAKDRGILDVGSFVGLFPDFMRQQGYSDINGIEMNPHFARMAERMGYPVRQAEAKMAELGRRFDMITCIQMFHNDFNQPKSIIDRDILDVMSNLRLMLDEDGIILVGAYIPLPLKRIEDLRLKSLYPGYSRRTGTYVFKNDRS
jgi:2-polyprenyl-3-methyl-5-hydroxy-6-metoxy-1,4-benzoquinol methylase